MKELSQKDYHYTIGKYPKPAISVSSGESILVVTPDNTANRVKKESDARMLKALDHWNSLVGPIFVENAKKGDALSIEVQKIEPLFTQGWGGMEPGGLCTSGDAKAGLYLVHETVDYNVKICPVTSETVEIPLKRKRSLSLPFAPMIGTIGVSPELDSVSSLICAAHGGNMDSPDICPGNKLLLPVQVDGGLLYLGDVHAIQSDGELGGPPLEIAAKCTLKIELLKNKTINWPRIESSEYIMTVGNSCPLDNSLRIACSEMLFLLRDEYGFSMEDAIFLSSTVFRCRINQVVNLSNSSVSVQFPRNCSIHSARGPNLLMLVRNIANSILKKATSYAILAVLILASIAIVPNFFRQRNLINILEQAAPLLIVSVGQTFAVLVSGIDLSVASVIACTNIILASTTGGSNEKAIPIIFLCLAFGFIVGCLNGWCIVKQRVPAFIMTLGMAIVLEGGRLVYTKGSAYGYIPSIIQQISKGRSGEFPYYIFIPIAIAAAALILLRRTVVGRSIYAIGGNTKAAYISGVKTDLVRISCYVICSVLAVVSGILLSGYLGVADNWAAKGYDMDSIAAVAVGGTAFSGGIGGVGGTIAGVLLIVLITNLLLFFGFGIETQLIGKALIVILAVSLYIRLKDLRFS